MNLLDLINEFWNITLWEEKQGILRDYKNENDFLERLVDYLKDKGIFVNYTDFHSKYREIYQLSVPYGYFAVK